MTVSRAEKARRENAGPEETSIAGAFAARFEAIAQTHDTLTWPNPKYEHDLAGFAFDICGTQLHPKQLVFAEAIMHGPKRWTSIVSGHRVGKTEFDAIAALWFYCTFPMARVFLMGPTMDTIKAAVWRAIVALLQNKVGCCFNCRKEAQALNPTAPIYPKPCPHSALIDGFLHESPRDGFKSKDLREIVGKSSDNPVSLQGLAGPHIFFIVDEASGCDDALFNVVQANMAGKHSAALVTFNPTKPFGYAYDSQHTKRETFNAFEVCSLDVLELGIDGLADQAWLDEMLARHGADSIEYMIRVLGKYPPQNEANKVIPPKIIQQAIDRWNARRAPLLDANGRLEADESDGPLHLGCDIAEFGEDDTAIAVVRGNTLVELIHRNGKSNREVADLIMATLADHRGPREQAWIKVDKPGPGLGVLDELNRHKTPLLHFIGVHPGAPPPLEDEYMLTRDQLGFSLLAWLRNAEIPNIERLRIELGCPTYSYDERNTKRKIQSKKEIKKLLGHSPDFFDALALAVWLQGTAPSVPAAVRRPDPYIQRPSGDAVYGGRGRRSDAVYGPRGSGGY